MLPSRQDVLAAEQRIGRHIAQTPLIPLAPFLSADEQALSGGREVWLKLDFLQPGGSFKLRGAFNRLLAAELQPGASVVAASGGNHGVAVAWAARSLGVHAHIFVPTTAPQAKVQRLRDLGAQVHQVGQEYAAALQASTHFAQETGATVSHAYDQWDTVCGQGTLLTEVQRQLAALPCPGASTAAGTRDSIVVAVGGGGLIGGMMAAADGAWQVIGVETAGCPTLAQALAAGTPVDIQPAGVAADSLGARRIGEIAFGLAREAQPVSLVVPDDTVLAARRWLWDRMRLVVEAGGATALAAWRNGLLQGDAAPGSMPPGRLVLVLCGANTDPQQL